MIRIEKQVVNQIEKNINISSFQTMIDKAAIGLSMLCAIHCLVFPVILVLLPSLAVLPLEDESFHYWMLVAVIPTSAYALTMGCRQHKHYSLFIPGILGLTSLIAALILGDIFQSETLEKALTLIGAVIIALVHYKNFKLCHRKSMTISGQSV